MFKLLARILVDPRHKKTGFARRFLEQQRPQCSLCYAQSERPRQSEQQYRFPVCPSSRIDRNLSPNRLVFSPLSAYFFVVLVKQIGRRCVSSPNGFLYENSPVGFFQRSWGLHVCW